MAAQVLADPTQAGTGAELFNTRKSLAQEQVGLTYEREFGAHDDLVAMVYGGHREIDIAMLALFGGLPDGFIESYEQVSPLALGWRDRIALHQLYPLAAHACLFGGGYGQRVTTLLATLLR